MTSYHVLFSWDDITIVLRASRALDIELNTSPAMVEKDRMMFDTKLTVDMIFDVIQSDI
jgi:hypothetical protein